MDEDKNQNKSTLVPGQPQLPGASSLGTNKSNIEEKKTNLGLPSFSPKSTIPSAGLSPAMPPVPPFSQPISRSPAIVSQPQSNIPIPQPPKTEKKPELAQESKPSSGDLAQKNPLSPSSLSSSIRTMQGDIQALMKGKAPSGEQLEKKFDIPTKAPVSIPPPPSLPPSLPRPLQPPQIKSPIVKLGELQKAKPLSPPSIFIPSSNASDKKENQSIITIPPGLLSPSINNKSLVLYALLLGAIAGGIYYIFFASKERSIPVSQSTPTSIISKSPLPTQSFVLNSSGNPFGQISIFVTNQNVFQGEIKLYSVVDELGDSYNFQEIAEKLSMTPPPALLQSLSADRVHLFVYGQKEYFSDTPIPKRYGLIAEVTSDTSLTSNLVSWENKMSYDFEKTFEFRISDASAPDFFDNIYKNTNIRYRNFPTPDKTIDYAVAVDFRGKKYLVFSNSREAMFNIIDNINKIFSNLKK